MKLLLIPMLLLATSGIGQCSENRTPKDIPLPVAVFVDSVGGIGWARAPVGYYSSHNDGLIRAYLKAQKLEDYRVPLFPLDVDLLRKIQATVGDGSTGGNLVKMNFAFVWIYSDGHTTKCVVGRDRLKNVIDILPTGAAERLFAMYSNAVRFNNPK